MASLDRDPDPYLEYGFQIRIQYSQNDVQKGKIRDLKFKEH